LIRLASRGSPARAQLTRTLHATTANSVFAAKRKRAKHGPGHPQSNEDPSTQGNGGFDADPCTLSAATTATRRKARVRGRRHQVARLTHERASQKTLCDLCRFEETRRRRVKSVMSRPAILQSADRRPVSCARPMSSFLPCSCCPGLRSLRARRWQQVRFVQIDDDALLSSTLDVRNASGEDIGKIEDMAFAGCSPLSSAACRRNLCSTARANAPVSTPSTLREIMQTV
jgi:hypothetical protein